MASFTVLAIVFALAIVLAIVPQWDPPVRHYFVSLALL